MRRLHRTVSYGGCGQPACELRRPFFFAGVHIFIDAKAQLTLLGTEMDFKETKLSSEFIFNNPNVKGTCGCGESFTV